MSGGASVVFAPIIYVVRFVVQTVFLAIGQVWANKVRSVLTALGIIFGVAAVIGTVAALGGMRGFVLKEFETFGARKMYMWGYVPEDLRTTVSWSDVKLSEYEGRLILDLSDSVDELTPICDQRMDIMYEGNVQRGVEVSGIWASWHEIEDRQMIFGRPFSEIDDDEKRQVCIVNEAAVEELALPTDPTGEYMIIDGRRFLCIGLVETKELNFIGGGGDSQGEVYIPFSTHKNINPYSWTNFLVQMDSTEVAADAEAEIRFILRKHRQLGPEEEDTFRIEVLQNIINQFNGLASGITVVAGIVVSISLLVGGIGIMNIMLVSVSERTREIGLRKAVGAKPPVVLMQFLIEATVLCLSGGLIGLAIGQGAALALRTSISWMAEASVSPLVVAGAMGFSALVGIVFGMFPAIKAASLNPIDALRHE